MAKLIRKVESVRFHRNDSDGESFFAVRFVGSNAQGTGCGEAIGLVFGLDVDPADNDDSAVRCCVVSITRPTARWNGNAFKAELIAAVSAACVDGSAFDHSPED